MSASVKNEPRKRDTIVKEVMAPTIKEGLTKLDEWCKSKYDFFLVSVEETDDFYVRMTIFGIEHDWTRHAYPV